MTSPSIARLQSSVRLARRQRWLSDSPLLVSNFVFMYQRYTFILIIGTLLLCSYCSFLAFYCQNIYRWKGPKGCPQLWNVISTPPPPPPPPPKKKKKYYYGLHEATVILERWFPVCGWLSGPQINLHWYSWNWLVFILWSIDSFPCAEVDP